MTLLRSMQIASGACVTSIKPLTSPLLGFLAALLFVCSARADLADDFVAALRGRGWHDTVLEYLDEAEDDPLASPAFRSKLDYERAVTLAALARQAASEKERQSLIAKAARGFQKFANEKTNSRLQLQALSTAGNLLTEQALLAINKAAKLPKAAGQQREQLHATARDYLQQAEKPLLTLLEQCEQKIESLPKATELQANRGAQPGRQQLEGKQAEAKFLLAKLDFEKSRTYASESKAQKQVLKTAAQAFAQLYEDYEDKLVGFYARLYEGRSYQTAGKLKKALECYWDIADQPPIANLDFRRLVARAYRHRAECHLASQDLDKVIEECGEWLEESQLAELREPEWLAVSYQLATAYEAKAADAQGADVQRFRGLARKLFREIAKNPGEFQRDAKTKMASAGAGPAKAIVVNTFEEAFSAGKDAIEQMNSAKLAAKLAKENNPDSYDSLAAQSKSHQTAAAKYFRQASQLSDRQTDRNQLATARYYLCWLFWEEGRLHDAAVVGEFLARRYPEHKYAPPAAKLALAAYERLYNAAKQAKDSSEFESEQLASVAELLAQRWPDSPEAATAINLLINVALRDDKLAEAEAMLKRLPASSRAGAELRLGGSLWTRYLKVSNKKTPDEAALKLKTKAGQLLANGYKGIVAKPSPTSAEIAGVLYYAQFLLADGDAKQAVAVIENAAVGPLALVQADSAITQRPEFIQETYKVALRSYLSVEPPNRDKAQKMMTALEKAIGDQGDSQQKLISIYVSLGLQLQQQISSLTAAGHAAKAQTVAASFQDLLERVTQRAGAADDWKVQSWIAQTNLQLGQGLKGKAAARYFQAAEKAYRQLLSKAEKNPKFAPSPIALLATKKRLADCLQAQQKYANAFNQYLAVLKAKPTMLELQQAAATALQQWGTEKKDLAKLEESIRGSQPQANKKNLVWGWLRLATIADQAKRRAAKKAGDNAANDNKVAKYRDLFFEARFHAAEARFATAKLAKGAERDKQLKRARQSIESMKRLYPNLGGPNWQRAYQELLKQMEQEK